MAGLCVLLTNSLLSERTGSEVTTEQLADGLRRAGHLPIVYVSRIGPQGEAMRARGHAVVDRLSALPDRPEVIHGTHNMMTMMALAALQGVPALFVCHDATAMHDAAPPHPRIRRYYGVSEVARRRLVIDGAPPELCGVLPNPVDPLLFRPRPPLPPRPGRALAICKPAPPRAAIRAACAAAGLALDEVGTGAGRVSERIHEELTRYDLVFASGRGALEAGFTGCAVVICESRGFGGLLTSAAPELWRRGNCGAGTLTRPVDAAAIAEAIAAYDADDALAVSLAMREALSLDAHVERLVPVYHDMIRETGDVSAEAEASAMARFLEDFLPSHAPARPWRALVRDITGIAPDDSPPPVAGAIPSVEHRDGAATETVGPEPRPESAFRRLWRNLPVLRPRRTGIGDLQ